MTLKAYINYLFIFIFLSSLWHFIGQDEINVISWDVYGYYLYLPSIFKYQDISTFDFVFNHIKDYPIAGEVYQVYPIRDGVFAPIYTIGMAFIYLPFFLIAHLIAWIGPYPTDTLSLPYQWSIIICSWVNVYLALYFSEKLLNKLALKKWLGLLTLTIIFLGTNLFHYLAYEPGMPHAYLFSLYAILIYYTVLWHQQPSIKKTIVIGVIISLLSLCRPSEVISLLIPVLYGVYNKETLIKKLQLLRQYWKHIICLAIIAFLFALPQVLYWKLGHGDWIFNGYRDHHFDYLSPHFYEGFFSYRKGWLIYTPIMLLSLVGMFFIPKESQLRSSIWFFFLLNIYIVFSWHIWWYASSFGCRAIIQSYAVLMIPLAFVINKLWSVKMARVLIILFAFSAIILNQFQDWQYRQGILLQDEMTRTYYKASFGKVKQDRSLRKYVDSDEKYFGTKRFKPFIQLENLDTFSSGHQTILPEGFSNKILIEINKENIDTLKGQWLSINALLSYQGNAFNKYNAARLVCASNSNGESVKWTGVRFQRFITEGETQWVNFDYKVPDQLTEGDNVECYIWNNGKDTIYLKEMVINCLQ